MKQKCIICGIVLEPSKENEIAQIEFVKRNKLDPSVLCPILVPTLGECKDGGLHETKFEDEDRQRMVNIISDYDGEVAKLDNERKHNGILVNKKEEILTQLRQISEEIRESTHNIVESEGDIETILVDYEAIANTKDIDFYRKMPNKEETKKENPEDKK